MKNKIPAPPGPARIKIASLFIGLAIFLLVIGIYLLRPQILSDIEGRLLDARFKLRGPVEVSGLVNIVAVDEASLEALGQWPWSRDIVAELIKKINEAGAIAIGLDIVFSEPQDDQLLGSLDKLKSLSNAERTSIRRQLTSIAPDRVLSNTLFDADNVVNGQFFYQTKEKTEHGNPLSDEEERTLLATSTVAAVRAKTDDFPALDAVAVRHNIPLIANAGLGAGYFNFIPGRDGIIRSAPLVMRYKEQFYPSLAFKTLSHYLDGSPIVVYAEEYGITHVSVGGIEIPTDELGTIVLNFRGPPKTIPTYSAVDVIHGNIPENAFAESMVLLGVTAIGVYDAHSTPFGPSFPGLEVQANVAENIIQGDTIRHSALEALYDLATIALIVLLMSIAIPRYSHSYSRFMFAAGLLGIYLALNFYMFHQQQLWMNMVYPLFAWLLTYLGLNLYLTLLVENRYSSVRTAFKFYLHPELVDQMTQRPDLLQFGGEHRFLTIMFTDIRSFTDLSEKLTPQQLAHFLQCYMDPMTEQVLNHHGTVDKYIGDAIMAIYGAPVPSEQHPAEACITALDMVDSLDGIKNCCPELAHVFPVRMGVGIHTGDVVVGNLGSSFHFTYTVIGDNVNLASRLEGLSKAYGVNIVVSETTYEAVNKQFVFRELDRVRVKGKKIPIKIYELRGREKSPAERILLERWTQAMHLFHDRQWQLAWQAFSGLAQSIPNDKTCQLYVERCLAFIEEPPPRDWDGVTTLTSK